MRRTGVVGSEVEVLAGPRSHRPLPKITGEGETLAVYLLMTRLRKLQASLVDHISRMSIMWHF